MGYRKLLKEQGFLPEHVLVSIADVKYNAALYEYNRYSWLPVGRAEANLADKQASCTAAPERQFDSPSGRRPRGMKQAPVCDEHNHGCLAEADG